TGKALRWPALDTFPPGQVLLVTDERCPLALGDQTDAKGRDYFDDLRRRDRGRLTHVVLRLDEYARLDALQAVLRMARSGDLEIELDKGATHAVSEREVIESFRRQGWHVALPVLRELFPESAPGVAAPAKRP